MKRKKILATILIGVMALSTMVGCSSKKEEASTQKEITIWTKLPEKEVPVLKESAEKWAEQTGNKVTVIRDDGDFQAFLQAANSSKGPDIYFGSAHNQLAAYSDAGIVTEVPEEFINKEDFISDAVWDATTIEGKTYAIPLGIETTALYYNKDLVKEVPKTMDELIEVASGLGEGSFQFNLLDPYTNLGFILTPGGYIFGGEDGNLDPTDIGLANDGAKKGYKVLQDLVLKNKFMTVDIRDDVALNNFKEGKSAFYISGPWNIQTLKESGLNFGIAQMPTIDGKEYTALSGIQVGFVSSKAKDIDLSWECLDFLIKDTQNGLYEKGKIPVVKEMLEKEEVKNDEFVSAFLKAASVAVPMPNIREMDAVWSPLNNTIRILQGEDIDTVANEIVEGIKEGILLQNQ